ncbi:DUF2254 family protein [Rhodococcus sp. JVH1]|uniref:DUF2254 family protein n=1 Tax=Rhodococcus sp. JVH1 TaxID=745408 RepID=UPI00027217D9|nr:DUF2254 family protein [Rhodococcus sp. JVH1]EJI97223.1 putative membrane protein [Rhodococcus sp. JVH1]
MNRAAEFPRSGSDSRPILRALRRRPPLRLGLVQLGYLFGGFLLGLALPTLDIGPRTSGTSVATLLFTLAGAVITPASVVFSLLFLVGQFGATTLTPRLTLFRDDPLVWNSFGMFLGFFVFATTAGLVVNHPVDRHRRDALSDRPAEAGAPRARGGCPRADAGPGG